jgi:uncharacterized membrane protein
MRVPGQLLDVERRRVLPVDAVPDLAKPSKIAQPLGIGRFAGHLIDGATGMPIGGLSTGHVATIIDQNGW